MEYNLIQLGNKIELSQNTIDNGIEAIFTRCESLHDRVVEQENSLQQTYVKLDEISSMIQSMVDREHRGPQNFDIGSPSRTDERPVAIPMPTFNGRSTRRDPWHQSQGDPWLPNLPDPSLVAPTSFRTPTRDRQSMGYDGLDGMQAPGVQSPPMVTFNDLSDGHYDQRAVNFGSNRTQVAQGFGNEHSTNHNNKQSIYGVGMSVMSQQNYRVCQKPNPRLFVFDGSAQNYPYWRSRMCDHLCNRSTARYKSLLLNIENAKGEITKERLMATSVDGVNAWEVAVAMDGFIFDWVNIDLYNRREDLTSGEEGNGFEAWRRIHEECKGEGPIVNHGGFKRLQSWPKCEDIKKLHQHLADWEICLNKYGSNLKQCPQELRIMILDIIPEKMKDEIIHKDAEYPTYQSILRFCRKRTIHLRHREFAELARNPKGPNVPRGHLNHFEMPGNGAFGDYQPPGAEVGIEGPSMQEQQSSQAGQQSAAPSWAQDLLNAVRAIPKPKVKAKAKPRAGPHTERGGGGRNASGFVWPSNQCFQCKGDHKLRECPEWKNIIGSDGKAPKGHETARDKAFKRWKENQAKKGKLNQFQSEEFEFEDTEDEDSIGELACGLFAPVTRGTKWTQAQYSYGCDPAQCSTHTINSFADLADDKKVEVEEHCEPPKPSDLANTVESLNQWAHRINIARSTKKDKKKINVLKTTKDIEDLIKPLSWDINELNKCAKLCPSNKLLKPGERWLLMDTGANIDAADIEAHFPEYSNLISNCDVPSASAGAECASGTLVRAEGSALVHGSLDGHRDAIDFKHMKIKIPIASMKNRVAGPDGYDVFITEEGGALRHRRTGDVIQMFDRSGVYFCKWKTSLPPLSNGLPIESGFTRLG